MYVSATHRKILMPWETTLANIFPNAPVLTCKGKQLISIDHGIDQTRFLRQIGYPAPAPILSQYDWAGGMPFDIQKQTAALLTTNYRAYVLNSFGTGKTKSALWAWHFLYLNGLAGKMLVVAPLSTLTFTWGAEIFKTLYGIKAQVLHGSRERRLKRLADPEASIFIINHDGLETILAELTKRGDIDTLCIDELAAYRNNSNRTKIIKKYAQPLKWVWGMTGSPTPNAPTDAWSQATVVTPQNVPRYFTHFRDQVMTRVTQFKYVPKPDAVQQVFKVLQPAVRFTLNDVMELPPLIERTQDVGLGVEQQRVYSEMAKYAKAKVATGDVDAMNAGAILNKLLQISTGYVYKRDGTTVELDNDERVDAMTDIVSAAEGKTIVFVPFKHALAGIMKALTLAGIEAQSVSGDTPKSARDAIFHEFQNDPLGLRVIAAHPATMSHGLTLTSADTIVWYGPTTSLETFEQANARITRVGQTRKQLVVMLQGTKAEKIIYAKLRAKQKVQNALLEMFEGESTVG